METIKLLKGDNMELLKTLEDNSVDSVVTDPPYALTSIKNRFGKPGSAEAQYGTDGVFQRASKGFMGKEWDSEVPSVEVWKEVLRVLKPGGHVLSFGGTRTYHHMVMNMELAGFEIRDSISYMYGSGFPKSHNVGKSIKKLNGSDDFDGIGTALKPSMELICLARKPLSEKSIAENVLKHGTGGINIDDCRIGIEGEDDRSAGRRTCNIFDEVKVSGGIDSPEYIPNPEGRFPANTILECICDEVIPGEKGEIIEHNGSGGIWSEGTKEPVGRTYNDKGDIHTNPECPCYILDKQSGNVSQGHWAKTKTTGFGEFGNGSLTYEGVGRKDKIKGGASRFFYTAKVSKKERNMGLDEFDYKEQTSIGSTYAGNQTTSKLGGNPDKPTEPKKNNHPTVKPVNLMTYLCRLITPPNGVVLDMYMGSGSTGISALLEGFNFIGMEMDEDYFNIAEARIKNFEQYRQFIKK